MGNNRADFKKQIDKIVLKKTDGNNLKNNFNNIDIDVNAVDRVLPLIRLDDRRFIYKEVRDRALRDKENIVKVEMRNILVHVHYIFKERDQQHSDAHDRGGDQIVYPAEIVEKG